MPSLWIRFKRLIFVSSCCNSGETKVRLLQQASQDSESIHHPEITSPKSDQIQKPNQ